MPAISITAFNTVDDGEIEEGNALKWRLRASVALAADLTINLNISAAGGDIGVPAGPVRLTVVLSMGNMTVDYSIQSVNDDVAGDDGRVTATVVAGAGYSVGAPASGEKYVTDNDSRFASVPGSPMAVTEGMTSTYTVVLFRVRMPPVLRRIPIELRWKTYSGCAILPGWIGRSKPSRPSTPKWRPCQWHCAPGCFGCLRRWRMSDWRLYAHRT